MQEITVEIADSPQKELPVNAVGPNSWAIYALWTPVPDDRGKEFTEVVEILWPDKKLFKRHPLLFRFKEAENHNVLVNVTGLPVGQAGTITINMWLEHDSRRVSDIHAWEVKVKHKLPTPVSS
jgi:hypothetical protein